MTCAAGRSSAASALGTSSNSAACRQGVDRGPDRRRDDRALIYGALLWMAEKLEGDQSEHAREVWTVKGKQAFQADRDGKESSDR
jgi:Conjugal transfer protein TraD